MSALPPKADIRLMLRHVCLVPQLDKAGPLSRAAAATASRPGRAPEQLPEPIVMIGWRAGCDGRREDGERGQELRTVDRPLHPHHRERDRNLRRSRHRDRYRMVYLSPTAAADIRAERRRLQDPHRPITLARARGARGGRYR